MKNRILLFLPATALFLYALAFSTLIHWSPGDQIAALAWNLGLLLAPPLAMLAQLKLARERGFTVIAALSVIAVVNTALVVGSRMGAWTGSDWQKVLQAGAMPELPGKTVMGGLLLAIGLFFLLKKWWRFSYGMADLLVLGMPLAAVSARVGCFVAGCCYGVETGSGWGICYGPGTPAFRHQAELFGATPDGGFTNPLFPVQELFIAGNLLIFFLLWQYRKRLSRPGAIALLGLSLLMAQRFGLEFLRDAASNRGELGRMVMGLKMVQWQSLLIGVVAISGWVYVQFFKKQLSPSAQLKPAPVSLLWPQTLTVFLIIVVSYTMRSVLTLDETLVILVSCLPALWVIAWQVWETRRREETWMAQLSFLSAGFILLTGYPIDSTRNKPGEQPWSQWIEMGGGGAFGKITRRDVSRDCDGNVTGVDYIHTNTNYGGGEMSYNWAKGATKFQIAGRTASGRYKSSESSEANDNNRFFALGLSTRFESRYFGLSLGFMHRKRNFTDNVFLERSYDKNILPVLSMRFGTREKLFLDCRVFDDPMVGLAMEPAVSFGINWGFRDPSGDTYVRAGMAFPSTFSLDDSGAFHLAGEYPIVKGSLYGTTSAYLGNIDMFSFGIRYRLNTNKK